MRVNPKNIKGVQVVCESEITSRIVGGRVIYPPLLPTMLLVG